MIRIEASQTFVKFINASTKVMSGLKEKYSSLSRLFDSPFNENTPDELSSEDTGELLSWVEEGASSSLLQLPPSCKTNLHCKTTVLVTIRTVRVSLVIYMYQISIKTPNLKCWFFLKIYQVLGGRCLSV
jgi:hypothetical protein